MYHHCVGQGFQVSADIISINNFEISSEIFYARVASPSCARLGLISVSVFSMSYTQIYIDLVSSCQLALEQ